MSEAFVLQRSEEIQSSVGAVRKTRGLDCDYSDRCLSPFLTASIPFLLFSSQISGSISAPSVIGSSFLPQLPSYRVLSPTPVRQSGVSFAPLNTNFSFGWPV